MSITAPTHRIEHTNGLHPHQDQTAKEEGRAALSTTKTASRRRGFPTFKEWIGTYWIHILTMAAMGAVGLGALFERGG